MFSLAKTTALGRTGVIHTDHGDIPTPCFMPVGTAGAMKGITFADLDDLAADILLCNTYHLHLHPGEDIIAEAGGLHAFTGWKKPIITDSGGFQVFSLKSIRKISDTGVEFRSHRNGEKHFIGPKEAMEIQHKFGSDIIMCFDECPASTAKRSEIQKAVDRTLLWAKECMKRHMELKKTDKHAVKLFGIVQGGLERDLRQKCAEELIAMGFDGYAVGGLAVGESPEEMYGVLEDVCPLLPAEKPRYLMGVGDLEQIHKAVATGIDMFDCVMPMREARHGRLLLSNGEHLRIRRNEFKTDHSPIDAASPSKLSHMHTKSYLHHLMILGERYGETISCMQNMAVTLDHMQKLRKSIG
jgi:queuine tRNA-ribosyltransferase